ncbi:MAG: hypothetical protein OSB28_06880 [Flavobacteriales bacterium]|nr:hypothetical protein [Flavobacteriales bacterium]
MYRVSERGLLEILKFLEKSLLIFTGVLFVGVLIISSFEDFGGRLILAHGVLLLLMSGVISALEKGGDDMVRSNVIAFLASVICLVFVHHWHSFQPHEYLLAGVLLASLFSAIMSRWHDVLRLSVAIIAWGYAYTNITTEIISHSNHRPELILELGDTVSMGPYFASFIENDEEGIKVEYFDVIPRLYKKGSQVIVDDMMFRSRADHYTSLDFLIDLEEYWTIVPFIDDGKKLEAEVWSNGIAGEKLFEFTNLYHESSKRRTIAYDVKNEILAESADGKMIVIRATKLPLTIVILLGGLMFFISLIIRIFKTLLKQ